mmetsp:Transcript_10727/g.15784  ORF Transcript_10727/g.15784 Transcript_10727/m.15784 type:complete len:237 (-) Transcript_10727:304-1014(-)|eukprot:CAMPEP_0194217110 /NCGR_PEP_ID=MMETSP0156-20130528/20379_1 /TAXON_ID=33649 /ORGANISM="Thalassionema nitzschioides, Strain L26-B" /LENGTH=236 /DNA_ID=CAMNT_0038946063 /DNA_START=312 /DNA_END=1022 /DNA_ORIENTATION=+
MVAAKTQDEEIRILHVEIEKESSEKSLGKMEMDDDDDEDEASLVLSKSVSFFPGVSVREVLHVNDYTDDEMILTWYRGEDYQKIKMSFYHVVQKISSGCWRGDTDQETSRGLEYRHMEGSNRRKTNKLNGLMAVLDEQERQWKEGFEDDESIRAVYHMVTVDCAQSAYLMGINDEQDVQNIWGEEKNESTIPPETEGRRESSGKARLREIMRRMNSQKNVRAPANPNQLVDVELQE